jgi:hypothetical protein
LRLYLADFKAIEPIRLILIRLDAPGKLPRRRMKAQGRAENNGRELKTI